MAKKKSPQVTLPRINLTAFFSRFHAVTFVIIVGGGLAVGVYLLTTILDGASAPADYTPPSTNTSFDTETIEKIEQLRPLSSPPAPPELPVGRTDPFGQ